MADDKQAIKSYRDGIQARAAAAQETKRAASTMPNLSEAAVSYDPKHGVQTLGELGEQQRVDHPRSEASGLSPNTIEGLRSLREAQERMQPQPTQQPLPKVTPPAAPHQAQTPAPETDDPAPDMLDPEDAALQEAIQRIREDVLNNERERKAVADRVKPLDLSQGIIDNAFTQVVPIVPSKLLVTFRMLGNAENHALRLLVLDEVKEDPRKNQFANDLLSIYTCVAAVQQVNTTVFEAHMVHDGSNPYGVATFSPEIYKRKLAAFMNFPMPLISSLTVHGMWFEQRVRELFTSTEALKNG